MERALTIILGIIAIGAIGYIIYDKIIKPKIEKEIPKEEKYPTPITAPGIIPTEIPAEKPAANIIDLYVKYE